ncbi:MAG: class I SAM-dependent methyltransferase [Phycisphaerales bacterium]|nr:class I SAM-dependent methyltransferase [Phycisphaerales bacterium]
MTGVRAALTAVFRGRRTISVQGIRYTERTTEPLHRALGDRGPGFKDYDALFPEAAPLRIRCTASRPYADIVGPAILAPYRQSDPIIRPGMRVLDARCSTGYGAAHLAQQVGPSGAVVALDPDHESIRFARRRYPYGNVSFEIGGPDSVSGEFEGAFDAIVAVELLQDAEQAARTLAGLWRVLAPGGPMLLVQPLPVTGARAPEAGAAGPWRLSAPELRNLLHGLHPEPRIEPTETVELAALIARQPPPPEPKHAPPSGGPYPPMR